MFDNVGIEADNNDYSSVVGLLVSDDFLRLRGVDLRAPACRGPLSFETGVSAFSKLPEATIVWGGTVKATFFSFVSFSIERG